jgi:hypothetical protein
LEEKRAKQWDKMKAKQMGKMMVHMKADMKVE